MIKPLTWMFKVENFKEHYWKLFRNYIFYVVLSFILMFLSVGFKNYQTLSFCFLAASIIIFVLPFLLCQGYFWELTDEAINRDYDITASEVYDGTIKKIFKISLPKWNTKKFIWRGVASIVATIILYVPLVALMIFGIFLGTLPMYEMYAIPIFSLFAFEVTPLMMLCLLAYLITPALLWNYAKRNSIISVLNIRAAIYLIGNYFGKYCLNSIGLIVLYAVDYLVMCLLIKLFFGNGILAAQDNLFGLVLFGIFFLIWVLKYLYTIFVCAYLLGTIADTGDGLG